MYAQNLCVETNLEVRNCRNKCLQYVAMEVLLIVKTSRNTAWSPLERIQEFTSPFLFDPTVISNLNPTSLIPEHGVTVYSTVTKTLAHFEVVLAFIYMAPDSFTVTFCNMTVASLIQTNLACTRVTQEILGEKRNVRQAASFPLFLAFLPSFLFFFCLSIIMSLQFMFFFF